jgi:DHA1 family multidrug resistance protein-like MFS transporter
MSARFYYLLVTIFLFSLSTNVPKPIYPHYVLSFTTSYLVVGSVLSGLGYSRVFIETPLSLIVDRYGRRRIALLGNFILVVSALIGGLALDLFYLIISVILSGLSSSLFFSSSFGIIKDLAPSKRIGGYFGSNIAAIFLGSIFGPLLGGYLSSLYGLRIPFLAASGFALISLGLLYKGTGETREKTIQTVEKSQYNPLIYIRKLVSSKKLIFINLLGFLNPFTMSCIVSTILPIYGREIIGLNFTQIGMILSIMSVSSFVVSAPSGLISDNVGRKLLLALGFTFFAVATLLLPFSSNMLILLIPTILLGLGDGIIGPAMWASLSDMTDPQETAISIGVFRTFIAIGLIMGPTSAGIILSSFSFNTAFRFVALLALIAITGNIAIFSKKTD